VIGRKKLVEENFTTPTEKSCISQPGHALQAIASKDMDFAHDFLRHTELNSLVRVSRSINAWISPEQDAIVMGYNVSPDMKGLSWAAAFNGTYVLKDEIRVIREVVQGNSLFMDVMRTAKQTPFYSAS